MSRLSRKEMKRDEVAETVGSVVDYTRTHARALIWGAAALAGLVVIGVGAWLWYAGQQRAAAVALSEALAPLGETGELDDAARRELEEVESRHRGSAAAGVARVLLGRSAASRGERDRARELWRRQAEGDDAVAMQARLNLYELDREEGRYEEVAGELEAALASGRDALPPDLLLFQLGLTYEAAGRPEEARQAWERLREEHPESPLGADAQLRAERLGPPAAAG